MNAKYQMINVKQSIKKKHRAKRVFKIKPELQ